MRRARGSQIDSREGGSFEEETIGREMRGSRTAREGGEWRVNNG